MVSAFDKLSIDATGKIDMGVVSEEVHNRYKEWGFKGLGWGSVKQAWNDVDTTVTRLSGNDVSLNAKGPITGTGVKIAAVNDLLMKTDDTIRLEAAQDALYFTEKGFYVGLSFPGSAGIDAALKGGSGGQILSGLAGINPITAKLATLANADNGLAAGLAAVNLATTGASIFGGAAKAGGGGDTQISTDAFKNALNDRLNPLSQFTDENGNFSAKNFGINLSVWKSEQRWSESQISELTAGGDIVMKAGLDVILDQGTKMVSGGDVSIDAGRDILMAALVDYAKDKSSSFGLQLSLSSIGFDIGKSKGYDETLTNASITSAGNVSLTSGRDTALLGGNIIGRTVDLDVGRDLAILSPQAQGWRDGFSFGLTVGVNPADWSVRGSKEDGFKAWSSGSGIVAAQGIDIKVAEDTTLVGALLQATDGDISLDTGTLTVADLKDTDQYKNVGGSIGISGGGLNSVGFSYEKKDKQGETRTTLDASGELNVTIRDADKDGVAGTEADKAAAEELLASINKDASKYQEITKDSYTKLSGELDVEALRNLKRNLDFALRYSQAQDAAVPGWIAAEGPHAIDQYREAILYGGATPAEAEELMKTPRFQAMLQERKSFDALKQGALNSEDLLKSIMLIQQGEELYRDPTSGNLMVRTACGTNGPCGVEISKLRLEATETVARFIEQRLEKGDDAALQEALECALAYALVRGDVSHFETLKSSGKFDAVAIQKYADAATSIVGSNLQNEAPALAADGIDITMALTKIVMASENGRIDAAQFNQLIDILKTDGPSGQAASFRIAVALGTLGDAGSAYLKALSHRMLDDYVADAAAEQQVHKFIAENPDSPQAKEVKQLLAQGIAMSVAMAAIGVRFYDGKFESVKGTTGRFENVKAQNIDEEQFIANVKTTFSNSTVWTGVTRHNGELVVQRSDIELSPQNVILMKNGQAPFVRGADGNWEPVQLHHVGRETGQLIEVTRSQNAYNSVNGGPLHIPGPGGPVRQSGYSQSYWKQRYQSFVSSGQIVP